MKAFLPPVAFLISALVISGEVSANADIAKFPSSVRQYYPDGTYSEFSCADSIINDRKKMDCVFTYVSNGLSRTYKYEPHLYGYTDEITDYRFFEHKVESTLYLIYEVTCRDEDLALIQNATYETTRCSLILSPSGDRLVPSDVDVLWSDGKNFVDRYRKPSFVDR